MEEWWLLIVKSLSELRIAITGVFIERQNNKRFETAQSVILEFNLSF